VKVTEKLASRSRIGEASFSISIETVYNRPESSRRRGARPYKPGNVLTKVNAPNPL